MLRVWKLNIGKKPAPKSITPADLEKLATRDDVGAIEKNLIDERRSEIWNSLDKRTKFKVLKHAAGLRGRYEKNEREKKGYHLF